MDSPVSAQEPEFEAQTPSSPRRLSALYQYHNAPEVAPAYGLEYDDTIYPVSDKMTIVREFPFHSRLHRNLVAGNRVFDDDNRPPRIIFGMKVGTFLVVSLVVLLVVIGAAVGGLVGGRNIRTSMPSQTNTFGAGGSPSASASISHTATPTISIYTAPTPTFTPLSACPNANNTMYTTPFALTAGGSSSSTAAISSSNQTYTLYCSLVPAGQSASKLAGAYVYTLSDCIDVCASYNFAKDTTACNVAFFQPSAPRPANCWIAAAQAIIGALEAEDGTDIGILVPPL